jgi:hypothetical protein
MPSIVFFLLLIVLTADVGNALQLAIFISASKSKVVSWKLEVVTGIWEQNRSWVRKVDVA